jgi:ribokinase
MLDLISIGDVTEDVFVEVDDVAKVKCEGKQCVLEFTFPTKLAIKKVDKLIGGNAGNMAIGGSRLGLRTALYAEVGADTQGDRLYKSLKDNKVSTKYFYRKKGEKTNYSVVLYFKGDRTILVHHELRQYKFPKLAKAKWIYVTSMAKGSERTFAPLVKYLNKTKAKLGFNPGTHQLKLGLSKIKPALKKTDVIFLNTEETQRLLKTNKRDFHYLTRKLCETGPKMAVVTDGPNGSYCFDGEKYYFCPIYDVPIMERTGCGDAFSTGFLSALAFGKDVQEALVWGTINSASVISKVGPQDGLIKLSLLKKIIKTNPAFKPREYNSKEVTKNKLYKPRKYKRL